MSRVFVSIGSNIDKRRNIVSSVRDMSACFEQLRASPVYESEATGFEGDNFYNLVVSFHTDLSPARVADTLDEVEHAHGRWRQENRFVSRTLDLDQLLYDDVILNANGIRLPHTDIMAYSYVLLPLARLARSDRHPVLGKTYGQLWRERNEMSPALREVDVPELADLVQAYEPARSFSGSSRD